MTANKEGTYSVPSLLKSAYHACNEIQRNKFKELKVPSVTQSSCEKLFKIVKLNSEYGCHDPLGDRRRYMFEKAQPFVFYHFIINICDDAQFYGHTDCLRFTLEIGVPGSDSMDRHIEYLKCALKTEHLLDESACSNSTLNGHLDCLKYAFLNGCSSKRT
ncbi:unnamed protein product [Macrosiphum euphorbiae]|uniref:Uncharacterized protein n=1 Tax=Macrosiphum euphorbiae TaxID=13131 RepID=A0AAV0X6P6_9HEMI|nr:unnamed protein product [Macrosiphum euphorbiae]